MAGVYAGFSCDAIEFAMGVSIPTDLISILRSARGRRLDGRGRIAGEILPALVKQAFAERLA